jgi:hypothetical protein
MRARYYDPATSQFTSRDPLFTKTQSRYGYASSNPLNATDRSGLAAAEEYGLLISQDSGSAAGGSEAAAAAEDGGMTAVDTLLSETSTATDAGAVGGDAGAASAGAPGEAGTTSLGGDASATDSSATCGGLSFSADTQVLLANGTTTAISKLKPGDKVMATDPQTGKTQAETVTTVWLHDDKNLMDVMVKTANGTSAVHSTSNHLFWDLTTKSWTEAGQLHVGDQLFTPDGQLATVAGLNALPGSEWMWDLTVQNDHDFYVTVASSAVLVHNCPMPGEGGTQVVSKPTWQGQAGRIDVENPAPGVRPGQMHFQDWAGNKAQYNFENGAFLNGDGSVNSTAMDLLYNNLRFQTGVSRGLEWLGMG